MKTLSQGVCAWCGLIQGGELMVQFSLCPGSQLFLYLLRLQVDVGPLHEMLVGYCLGRRKKRGEKRVADTLSRSFCACSSMPL